MSLKNKKAQSILEYAVLLAIVVAVIVGLQLYVKRAVQGRIKGSADSIGEQFTTGETYTIQTISQSARREQTISTAADADLGNEWTRSEIQDASAWIPPEKKVEYQGYEVSKTDYVTATKGGGEVGAHGTFDSGKISDKNLWDDD